MFTISKWFLLLASVTITLVNWQHTNLFAQDLADVIEECEKSVVKINVKGARGESIGSGFVVSSDGMLVTNVHVLAGAETATATFADGQSYDITGTYYFDESRDICIAQLDGRRFAPIELSDDLPRKGESVVALGAPIGLDFTATTGIVSATREGESFGASRNLKGDWIQVDAALSPGNSGGPLINKDGDVIGMSTLASTGDAQNLNFGISAGDILDGLDIADGKPLVKFKDGIGEAKIKKGNNKSGILNSRPEILKENIIAYVEKCAEEYSFLREETLDLAKAREKRCEMMMRGRVKPLRFGEMEFLGGKGRRPNRVVYSTERIKEREVRKAKVELSAIEKFRSEVGEECTTDSLAALLGLAGLPIDIGKNGHVGMVRNLNPMVVMDDHVVAGRLVDGDSRFPVMSDREVTVWMSSTSEVSSFAVADPMTMFVAKPIEKKVFARGRTKKSKQTQYSISPAILVALESSELKEAIEQLDLKKATPKPGDEMRQWTAGKYNVMASVVSWDNKSVTLQKENGKQATVKRSILSNSDNEFLDGLKK